MRSRRIEAVYPLSAGLPPKTLKRAIQAALARLPAAATPPDWSDPALRQREGLDDLARRRPRGPSAGGGA